MRMRRGSWNILYAHRFPEIQIKCSFTSVRVSERERAGCSVLCASAREFYYKTIHMQNLFTCSQNLDLRLGWLLEPADFSLLVAPATKAMILPCKCLSHFDSNTPLWELCRRLLVHLEVWHCVNIQVFARRFI